jgi:aminoglycoside 6'-N-acetyltransferase
LNKPFNITFRDAGINDLVTLKYWDEQPHVIQSDPNDEWSWETELIRFPEWRRFLIAEIEGRPVGFTQVIDPALEETHYWGDVPENLRAIDIWIGEASDLGKGYGTVIMQFVIAECFKANNVTAILIDPLESNTEAIKFYKRLGFKFVEKRQFGEDKCDVYRLDRSYWETHS